MTFCFQEYIVLSIIVIRAILDVVLRLHNMWCHQLLYIFDHQVYTIFVYWQVDNNYSECYVAFLVGMDSVAVAGRF